MIGENFGQPPILSYPDSDFRNSLCYEVIRSSTPHPKLKAEESRKQVREFCQKVIRNIDEYPYLYFTAGATEALNYFCTSRSIRVQENEYRYVFTFPNVGLDSGDFLLMSYPFSGSGKFQPLPKDRKLILDLAYIFATDCCEPVEVPPLTDALIFSLSKSHNLADLRIGWFFSKTKIESFHMLQYEYGYMNSLVHQVVQKVTQEPPNLLFQKNKMAFDRLYKKHGLVSFDTNLFGFDLSGKRIPYYLLLPQWRGDQN